MKNDLSPILLICLFLAPCGIAGCTARPHPDAAQAESATARTADEPRPEPVDVGETDPAHRYETYYLAAQPTAEDLQKWKDVGIHSVINLRMPHEINWDEQQAVERLGMQYVSIPFAGPQSLTDEVIQQSLQALAEEDHQPVLLHCASSNRTGAIWYAHRIVNDGVDRETALAEARQIGLRTMGYIQRIDEYLDADM